MKFLVRLFWAFCLLFSTHIYASFTDMKDMDGHILSHFSLEDLVWTGAVSKKYYITSSHETKCWEKVFNQYLSHLFSLSKRKEVTSRQAFLEALQVATAYQKEEINSWQKRSHRRHGELYPIDQLHPLHAPENRDFYLEENDYLISLEGEFAL